MTFSVKFIRLKISSFEFFSPIHCWLKSEDSGIDYVCCMICRRFLSSQNATPFGKKPRPIDFILLDILHFFLDFPQLCYSLYYILIFTYKPLKRNLKRPL